MKQISLSKDIVDKHKAYFKDKIVNNLKNDSVDFSKLDLKKVSEVLIREITSVEDIKNIHTDFINFCIEKEEILSIGTPDKLREFICEVKARYNDILLLIENSDKIYKNTHATSKYSERLLDIFGYDKFTSFDITERIIALAKNGDKRKYGKDFYVNVREILINKLAISERNIPDGLTKFNIKKILKEHLPYITINNFDKFVELIGWNGYAFVLMSGIRVCPYCNRQYITPIYSKNGKLRADLDHFYPKSKYPFLSMSIYNLVPCCKFCNSSLKGDKEMGLDDINPYEKSYNDYFSFTASLFGDMIQTNIKGKGTDIQQQISRYLNMFAIKELYNYHTNQADELIKKRLIYSDDYINDLYNSNKILFKDKEQLKELIVGYIEDEDKINEEAFLKFRRDISKQLKFIEEKIDDNEIENLKNILKEGVK